MAEETLTATATPTATAAVPAPAPQVRKPVGPDKAGFYWGTGRRKTAVARVRLKPGSGKLLINNREYKTFFLQYRDQMDVTAPLRATKTGESLDIMANVNGGGVTGQAGAVKLGIARALMGFDPSLEPILRENKYLTRDDRKVERKKYGQSGARRRFQFSKR